MTLWERCFILAQVIRDRNKIPADDMERLLEETACVLEEVSQQLRPQVLASMVDELRNVLMDLRGEL